MSHLPPALAKDRLNRQSHSQSHNSQWHCCFFPPQIFLLIFWCWKGPFLHLFALFISASSLKITVFYHMGANLLFFTVDVHNLWENKHMFGVFISLIKIKNFPPSELINVCCVEVLQKVRKYVNLNTGSHPQMMRMQQPLLVFCEILCKSRHSHIPTHYWMSDVQ